MPQTEHRFNTTLELPVSLPYLLHLPDGHEQRSDWPLVVFLHGSGERGDDLGLLRGQGLPRSLDEGLSLPAVVLSPQCPKEHVWPQHFPAIMALIDRTIAEQGVDPDRVVLTGLSLGGAGSCHLAATYPDRFAALAPICGPWTWFYVTPASALLPLWAFHGDADPVVAVEDSRRLVAAVRELNGRARLTEYPGVGHDAWSQAYADPELQAWLVSQQRTQP